MKIQIEWNPAQVAEYRLIGYENRLLNREDFNNDKVDAGDIGAGHTVTALYEITLKGEPGQIDPLRYGSTEATHGKGGELAFLKLRYKAPEGETSQLITHPIDIKQMETKLDRTSESYRFSAAVAAFGQLLRGGRYTGKFAYDDVEKLARSARGEDKFGYRSEFLQLVRQAATLCDLDIGGRIRRLRIERRNGHYQVAVDDRVFEVDPRPVARETWSLLLHEDGGPVRSVDATITARPGRGTLEVTLDGRTLPATLATRFGMRAGEGRASGGGPQQVTAPMPGKVVRVLVAPGDAVEPRQGLVVIEAMKMENELRASRAGRVKTVRAAEAQSVEAGALLVIVE